MEKDQKSFRLDSSTPKADDFKKHPIRNTFYGIIISIAFIMMISSLGGDSDKTAQTAPPEQPSAAAPEIATINYQIIYTDNHRFDNATKYYILIDKIDARNDAFKTDVKNIIRKEVAAKGGKLSLAIFDDRKAMDVLYKQYGDQSLGRVRTDAESDFLAQHHIATFYGQFPSQEYNNTLYFFEAASKDTPSVGKYGEMSEFNP